MVYLAIAAGAALGGFIQSITGFGSAVMLMTVLPHFFDMTLAPSVSTAICLGLSATLAWRLRRRVSARVCLLPTILYTASSMMMIELLGAIDLGTLTVLFGVLLILLGIYMLLRGGRTVKMSRTLAISCSLIAGITGGLFSIGGPIMAIYYLAATDDHESYIANAQANYVVANVANLALRVANGYFSLGLLPLSCVGIAGVVLGQKLGLRLGGRLNAAQLRRVVYCYVIFSGAVTVVQQLL